VRRAAAYAVICALLVLPSAPSTAQSETSGGDRRAAIEELLDRRARAVMERDEDAFMATVSTVSEEFRSRQRRLFEWMGDVPFKSYRLRAAWERAGDLLRPSDRARYPDAEDAVLPVTEELYRIAGADTAPAIEDHFYTFVKEGGRWLVAEDGDLDDLGLHTARHMWDFGPVGLTHQGRFLVIEHPCRRNRPCGELPAGFFSLAEQALERVGKYWKREAGETIVVLVPSSAKELRRMLQVTFDTENFVAFAYSTVDQRSGYDFTAPRIVFNYRSLANRSDESVLNILAHELLHVATRGASGPFMPVFIEEGFADYVGNDANLASLAFLGSEIGAGRFDRTLPQDFEFIVGDGTSIFRNYQESHSAVRFFIERWGLDEFVRFYRDLGRRELAGGTARYQLDDALEDATGFTLRGFERAWADSIGS
jgi:hypothetical protein